MILSETPRRKLVTNLVSWAHWFTLQNIVLAIVIASIYVFSSPLPGTAAGMGYLFANWFSHIGFLTFFSFVLLILPLCYLLPKASVVKGISSVLTALGLALLAFDALMYNKYGLHLSFSSAEQAQTVIAELNPTQWGFLALLFIAWLAFQLITANALWQRIERFQKIHIGTPITSFFLLCFVGSHSAHIWADANLYQPIIQQDDMFPLSYPATAKTLLSRYGMLDLESHKTQRALQFNTKLQTFNYPASPMYCGIDLQSKVLLLVQVDGKPLADFFAIRNLKPAKKQHFDFSQSTSELMFSALYGLPPLYQAGLSKTVPILLDMPLKLGLAVKLFTPDSVPVAGVKSLNWDEFKRAIATDEAKLAIGFVNQQQMEELVTQALLNQHRYLISTRANTGNYHSTLITNLPMADDNLSSTEDIAPSLAMAMGCKTPAINYSTGENLNQNQRDWLISNQANKVILLDKNVRFEINPNGSYKAVDLITNQPVEEQLNTGLFSQSMKHLNRFSRQ